MIKPTTTAVIHAGTRSWIPGSPKAGPNKITIVAIPAGTLIRQPATNADIAISNPAMPIDQGTIPRPRNLAGSADSLAVAAASRTALPSCFKSALPTPICFNVSMSLSESNNPCRLPQIAKIASNAQPAIRREGPPRASRRGASLSRSDRYLPLRARPALLSFGCVWLPRQPLHRTTPRARRRARLVSS